MRSDSVALSLARTIRRQQSVAIGLTALGRESTTGVDDCVTESPSLGPRRLSDLDLRARRRAIVRSALTLVVVWALLVTAYYLLPIGQEERSHVFVRLAADIALIVVILAWQVRRVMKADLPALRAVEALGVVAVFFLLVFATIYLSLSVTTPDTFTDHLDHTRALYLTITIFSTVGFGDITPKTDPARLLVSVQMLLDLVLIGTLVRLLLTATKVRLARQDSDAAS